jgi:hypothetical protein
MLMLMLLLLLLPLLLHRPSILLKQNQIKSNIISNQIKRRRWLSGCCAAHYTKAKK